MRILLFLFTLLVADLGLASSPASKPFVHGLFTDNMVLQRDTACPVWGWTTPQAKVTVQCNGQSVTGIADPNGKWMVKVGPFAAGGPHTLTIEGPQTVTLKNVVMGDVWLCSGQSNMEFGMGAVNQWWDEQASAKLPQVRLASIPFSSRFQPANSVDTNWRVSSRDAVFSNEPDWGGFSAIGFIFGREIHKQIGVPIGLIQSSVGATAIASWISPETLKKNADLGDAPFETFKQAVETAWKGMDPAYEATKDWASPTFNDSDWKTLELPKDVAWPLADFSGIVWLRKEIVIPKELTGLDLSLCTDGFEEKETLWWDGQFLDSNNAGKRDMPRYYSLPGKWVTPGRHVVVFRAIVASGTLGKWERMILQVDGDEKQSLSLAGPWHYKESTLTASLTPQGRYPEHRDISGAVYEGMVAPLAPFALKGVLWYQGEGNVGIASSYYSLLNHLVKDWRALFGNENLPFYFVQLSGFGAYPTEAGKGSGWAEVREAQFRASREIPHTGIAVAIDRGEIYNIHPPNKQDVGKRLALAALVGTYGKQAECSGPVYQSMKVEGASIRLFFDHAQGLISKGGVPVGFELAGPDKKYVWANAAIDGESIVVSAPGISEPCSVRYGWADHPLCNLYNGDNLPAAPFRTAD